MARQPRLPVDIDADDKAGGPVYQGTCAQIRAMYPTGPAAGHAARCKCEQCADTVKAKAAVAGWIAQARSLAGSIDRVSGHGGSRQASGVQLAAMHERLEVLLERIDPTAEGPDEWDTLQERLERVDREAADRGNTAPSHPQV